ncbi:hypothetical protein [Streptomyces sp. Ncost-T10-10d]|uniref:hypothetical protein n=1 Tax=Streptomyces sp. Ncost-T10-10d TaxID=1839774 RepID=UPI00081F14CE|nr:hypothetical protein [Streptomyces sp. Ncost-T10-10d]SCF65515.1 D-alanyl-D-alanine carboxypeptidase [Streptomyces sp. Ncost-T10-10d]
MSMRVGTPALVARVPSAPERPFFQALLGGEPLPRALMAEMQGTVPVDDKIQVFWPHGRYGLGLVNRPLSCGGSYWSHEGGDGGY